MRSLFYYYIARAHTQHQFYSCSSSSSSFSWRIALMAVNCTCSTQIPIQQYGSFLKYPNKELKSKRSSIPLKRAPALRITASIKNKVYEDKSQGIVCYQDEESGEIICEGYDEGPCFQRIPKPTYHPRDAEIKNLLIRQGWVQIVKEEEVELNDAVEGLSLKEDLNCNGFNSFR